MATRVGSAGIVLALVFLVARVDGAPSETTWQPPANADQILRYKIQEEAQSRLESRIRDARRAFDEKIMAIGKMLYDSGVTEAMVQGLVDEVIRRSGTKNPMINYQQDLKAVVEKAVDGLLEGADPGATREYIRQDVIKKLLQVVAVKGAQEVAPLVTRANMEEVVEEAHRQAQDRFRQEIESAKRTGRKIGDAAGLWKKIQQEEFDKAARNWMLKTLQENWGVGLRPGSPETKPIEDRARQIPGLDDGLSSFITAEVERLLAEARKQGLAPAAAQEKIAKFLSDWRGTMDAPITPAEEKIILAKATAPPIYSVPAGTVATGTPGGTGATDASSTAQATPPVIPIEARTVSGTGAAESQPSELRHYRFLIELQMKSRVESDAQVQIHLCQQGSKSWTDIAERDVMPPTEVRVKAFTPRDIDEAALAIQQVLEGQNGVNRCVDKAHKLAISESGARRTPSVQLDCCLRKDDRVFGLAWDEAVGQGVSNTAKNWAAVQNKAVENSSVVIIHFVKNSEAMVNPGN